MILKLGGKRAEAIAIDDILHALKIGFETRSCASEERENLSLPFEGLSRLWAIAAFAT